MSRKKIEYVQAQSTRDRVGSRVGLLFLLILFLLIHERVPASLPCEVQAKFSVLSSMRVAATILLLAFAPAHGLVVSPAARATVATAKPTVARCGTNPEMFIG